MGDVYVIVEQQNGEVAPVTYELLGKAKEIAPALGGAVVAVLVGGSGIATTAAQQLGAATRIVAVADERLSAYTPEAYKAAAVEALTGRDASVVLVGNTTMGMDLAAGLSIALGMPLVAYATGIATDGGRPLVTSRVYAGKIDAEVVLDRPGIVSVQAGSFPAAAGESSGSPEIEEVKTPAALDTLATTFKALHQPEGGDVDITAQDILVSVGRGIQNADNIPIVEELASALGGAVAASRPITDAGWLPKTRQVGKSGLAVKPKLYLMCGISGAPEHLEGMRDADLIVAINTDENAPIFDVAHYGITEDLLEVVPAITERLKK